MSAPKRKFWQRLGVYLGLTLTAAIILFPLYIAFSTSLKTPSQVFVQPYQWVPDPVTWENYPRVFQLVPLGRFLWNSVVQSTMTTLGVLITSSLAAYAIVYINFPGRNLIFGLMLATMMVSGEVTIIPNYLTIHRLGWVDTFWGLSVPFMATGFGIFLLRQFFMQVPKELYEAATIDGASRLRYLLTILLPLSRPALGTLGVYTFLSTWNQYFWPLIVTNRTAMRTVQIGIAMLRDSEGDAWHSIMAGVTIVTVPAIVVFLLFQKQLIRGIVGGALKG
ncbi:MAG: glycerol-3-phosphate ABC transporter permease [Firmicutes bacterium ZCTH02-B6]|nr:MAG: glycerol-3-phosphate ABC transporter permease [Firmicutes bacterium ZCTH02-B6]